MDRPGAGDYMGPHLRAHVEGRSSGGGRPVALRYTHGKTVPSGPALLPVNAHDIRLVAPSKRRLIAGQRRRLRRTIQTTALSCHPISRAPLGRGQWRLGREGRDIPASRKRRAAAVRRRCANALDSCASRARAFARCWGALAWADASSKRVDGRDARERGALPGGGLRRPAEGQGRADSTSSRRASSIPYV